MTRRYRSPRDENLSYPCSPWPETGAWGGGRFAVVVPVFTTCLTDDEIISLRSLRRHIGEHQVIVIAPEGLKLSDMLAAFNVQRLPSRVFRSISSYNAMMLSAGFYEALSGYEAVLIFQLDCLLLGHGVEPFIDNGASYIGAPFFKRSGAVKAVGNGGFSLRRPKDILSVLRSNQLYWPRNEGRSQLLKRPQRGVLLRCLSGALMGRHPGSALGQAVADRFPRAEDEFWSYYAPLFSSSYRVADTATALAFAAETLPRRVFALNGERAPLGAHAWNRIDRPFWDEKVAELGLLSETGSQPALTSISRA